MPMVENVTVIEMEMEMEMVMEMVMVEMDSRAWVLVGDIVLPRVNGLVVAAISKPTLGTEQLRRR